MYTLTGRFIRYTLQILCSTQVYLHNCRNSSWQTQGAGNIPEILSSCIQISAPLSSRIVISMSAWKSCHETDAPSLFNSFSSCLHEMLHLATTSQL